MFWDPRSLITSSWWFPQDPWLFWAWPDMTPCFSSLSLPSEAARSSCRHSAVINSGTRDSQDDHFFSFYALVCWRLPSPALHQAESIALLTFSWVVCSLIAGLRGPLGLFWRALLLGTGRGRCCVSEGCWLCSFLALRVAIFSWIGHCQTLSCFIKLLSRK